MRRILYVCGSVAALGLVPTLLGACSDEQVPPPIQPSGPGDPGENPVLEPSGGGEDELFTGAGGAPGVGGAPGFGQGGAETGFGGFAESEYF